MVTKLFYSLPMMERNEEVHYSVYEGASWSGATVVSAQATDFNYAGSLVMGASDRAHFFYVNDTDNDPMHRSLSSTNVLDTEQDADGVGGITLAGDYHTMGRGVAYADNGDTIVKVPYSDSAYSDRGEFSFYKWRGPNY